MEVSKNLAHAIGNALDGVAPINEKLGDAERQCHAHGAYMSTGTLYLGKREVWTPCPECALAAAEAEREEAQIAAAQRVSAGIEAMIEQTCIPKRFIGKTFDNFIVETKEQAHALKICRAYAERFDSVLTKGHSLILAGGVGTGKSHLAGAVLQAILPRHVGVYLTMLDLIRLLRDTWRQDATQTESQILTRLANVPLLVIDEVGLQYDTDGERTLFSDIMDRRYRNQMPVILLANKTVTEFKAIVGDRVHDRLSEVATWVPFSWESQRGKLRRDVNG